MLLARKTFNMKLKSKLDILNLEWSYSERDLAISLPVLEHLRRKYGITYLSRNIFNGFYYILRYRPKVLFIANTSGSFINVNIARFAHRLGIKVVSSVSEGNFVEDSLDAFLWGHNQEKDWFLETLMVWNQETKKMIAAKYAEFDKYVSVTGSLGIDRHVLTKKKSQAEFLRLLGKERQFDLVVTISGWCFDLMVLQNAPQMENFPEHNRRKIQIHLYDLPLLQKIYLQIAKDNPNTLFIFKYHPGTLSKKDHEFALVPDLPNTYFTPISGDPLSLTDYLSQSDLWVAYDSTTTIEAWSLGTPSILINPSETDFERHEIFRGSPILKSVEDLQKILDELKTTGKIAEFEKLTQLRATLIHKSVHSIDGQNYKLAGLHLMNALKQASCEISFPMKSLFYILGQTAKYLLLSRSFVQRFSSRYWYYREHDQKNLVARIINNLNLTT